MKSRYQDRIRISLAALAAAVGLAFAAPMFGALSEAADTNLQKAPRQEVQVRYLQAEDLHPQKLVRQISSENHMLLFQDETAQ